MSLTKCTLLVLEENMLLYLLVPLETIMPTAKLVSLLKHHFSPRHAERSSSAASGTGQQGRRQDFAKGGADARRKMPMPLRLEVWGLPRV